MSYKTELSSNNTDLQTILEMILALGLVDAPKSYLEFASASPFTMSVGTVGWDGTMEYDNGNGWTTWDGSEISSGTNEDKQYIHLRGTGNTKVTGDSTSYTWTLTGTNVECNGNIENLLDYVTVQAGNHPDMADYCYSNMFRSCTSLTTAPTLPATTLAERCYYCMFHKCTNLTTAPSLPATTLVSSCYQNMFSGCTSLTTAPSLPATTLSTYCYQNMFSDCTSLTTVPELPATALFIYCYRWMFQNCTSLKLSAANTGTYTKAYRIPTSGTGTISTDALTDMFTGTGGTFTGTPEINTTYYLDSSITIV